MRSWSKYQETVPWRTLCGSEYDPENSAASATEDADLVTCKNCLILMRPNPNDRPPTQKRIAWAEAKVKAEREASLRPERPQDAPGEASWG